MPHSIHWRIAITTALTLVWSVAGGANYFVNATGGDDANPGTSEGSAWRSLVRVNSKNFLPGDQILFKSGEVWTGQLNPKGSGKVGKAIVIDAYGNGPKPRIDGAGSEGQGTVFLFNQQYWEINNLEIVNNAPAGGDRRGIYLSASNFPAGVVNHLHVRNCRIRNIKGLVHETSDEAKRTGGILVEVIDDRRLPTRFHDVLIENCEISTVDNIGIALNNRISVKDYPGTPGWEARKFSQVVIRGNRIHDIAKNAMIIRLTDETGLIERNVCFDTAYRARSGNTIFSRSCRGTVFQYNEGYLNRATGSDGSLYDADLQSPGCIFQYSYSHDNSQGLYWQCTDQRDANVIVRYNISQNDHGIIFCLNYNCASTYIYNNVVYVSPELSPTIVDERRKGTKTYYFYNNIIYNRSPTTAYRWFNGERTFDYNIFYGFHPANEPEDKHKSIADPMFVNPGSGTLGLESLSGYRLLANSPCIDTGLNIPDGKQYDFWGNAVPVNRISDRGAQERPASEDL